MNGYLIADVTAIDDPGLSEGYQPLGPPSSRAFNGTYLARGDVTGLESSGHPHRQVIVRFESAAQAAAWWDAKIYGAAEVAVRARAAQPAQPHLASATGRTRPWQ